MIYRLVLSLAFLSLATFSTTLLAHKGPGSCDGSKPECSRWANLIEYPEWAQLEEVEGTITLHTNVDHVGHAVNCVILESSGDRRLDQSACDQFERVAHFNPVFDTDGKPVIGSFCTMITWRFSDSQPIAPRQSAYCKGGLEAVLDPYLRYHPTQAPLEKLREGLEAAHPAEAIFYAHRLMKEAKHEDALFWYLAGFLRWDTRLACREFEPGGEGAAFGALNLSSGREITLWGTANFDTWMATFEKVHAWDLATTERFHEDAECSLAAEQKRAELLSTRDYFQANRAEYEAKSTD